MRDTSPEAAAIRIAAFRRMSPGQRVALAFEASEWLFAVARARITAPESRLRSGRAPSILAEDGKGTRDG